jgi:predicted GH43/DUF377 family glycosyl hydrolase
MYYLFYAGWQRKQSVTHGVNIGMALSTDGQSFTRMSNGPILGMSINDPLLVSGPKVRRFNDTYYMFYLSGYKWILTQDGPENRYKIKMATSKNLITWKTCSEFIIPETLNIECQAGPDVIKINNLYYMFYSYRDAHNFKNKERGYRVGLAISNDLKYWDLADPGIERSEEGWDSEMMHYPHIFKLEDNYYMLYNGNNFGEEGFGLAILEEL